MRRVIYFLLCILLILPLVAVTKFIPDKKKRKLHNYFNKALTKALRIKVSAKGIISKNDPVLFVANHMSYTDILVLGSVLPACFVSKAEVAKWPVAGWIAYLIGTVFIDRKKSAAGNHLGQIEDAIFKDGKNLVIFPEGTTSDGRGVLPFKSSLFKIAENLPEGKKLTIQPVTISYTHINGLPIQANERKKIAWVGNASFGPHLIEFAKLGVVKVSVTIHPEITHYVDRKTLALECQKTVESAL